MNILSFEEDVRSQEPNQSGHRRARFREGWQQAVGGAVYSAETLRQLTWENLGYRLGAIFGQTSDERIDQLYDWCVRQQEE